MKETPEPKYKNTLVCTKCHAEYNPNVNWCRGVELETGTGPSKFHKLCEVKPGRCPFCGESK